MQYLTGCHSADSLNEFHRTLLPATLANAVTTPFYRKLWQSIDYQNITIDSLHQLPLVYKEDIRSAGLEAQNRHNLVCNEIFTGGTTGYPLVTVKGDREQRFIYQFYKECFCSSDGTDYRALQINNPYHGHLMAVPVPLHSHKIGIYDIGSFDYGRKVLQMQHNDRDVESKCTVLVGLERCLRAFTVDTLTKYPNGFENNLNYVISYSQLLTNKWRHVLENVWDCEVIDRFGLSEVFGGATYDTDVGWWHFDPVIIPEVVGVNSLEPIKEGKGILVVTALFPFQEAQPLVRYYTGDLVEMIPHEKASSALNYQMWIRPLGRARYGVAKPHSDEWLTTPASVFEVIDDIDEIERQPRFMDSPQVEDPYIIGHPKYKISYYPTTDYKTNIQLDIEFKKAEKTAHRKYLCNKIRDLIIENNIPLADAITKNEVELDINHVDNLNADLLSHAD